MPVGTWIYDVTTTAIGEGGEPIPPPEQNLPSPILGEVTVSQRYANDDRSRRITFVTIAASFPSGAGDVDRLKVYLRAPYNVADTQPASVEPDPAKGIVISDDPAGASKIVELSQPEFKTEQDWSASKPYVSFEHPSPQEKQKWQAIVVSGARTAWNKIESSPSAIFDVDPEAPDVGGREFAPTGLDFHFVDKPVLARWQKNVKAVVPLRWKEQSGGQWLWGWSAAWANDTKDPRFPQLEGYDLTVDYPGGLRETLVSKSVNDLTHDSDLWPLAAEDEDQAYTVWLVSYSKNGRNSIVEGLTPSVGFVLSPPGGGAGTEFAPLVTNLQLASGPTYVLGANQAYTLEFNLAWTKPDSSRYGGCIIKVNIVGGNFNEAISGIETGSSLHVSLSALPSVQRVWEFYAISVNPANAPNSYVEGTTPKLAVTVPPPPVGGAGSEYAPVCTGFTTTRVAYMVNATGQKVLVVDFTWARPAPLARFGGAMIQMARADAPANPDPAGLRDVSGLITDTKFSLQISDYKVADERYLFALISVNVEGRANTFQNGVTPFLIYTVSAPPTGTPLIGNFTASVGYTKDDMQANLTRFTGSFSQPVASSNPDWAGAKIWRGKQSDGSDAKPITEVIKGPNWETPWVPLVADSPIWLFAVSVDVNQKEAPVATSAKVGPLNITSPGTTIPDEYLDVAGVASAADVPGIFTAPYPVTDPALPEWLAAGTPKERTQMYHPGTKLLYRWVDPQGYKQVGAGTDLVARTIFAGIVAAAAIGSVEMSSQQIRIGPPLDANQNPQYTDLRPLVMTVENSQRAAMAVIGDYPGKGWQGIYGRRLRIGPTFEDWRLDADDTRLALNNIELQINGTNLKSYFRITPQTFDATYQSLAAQMHDTPSYGRSFASFISRGLVVWEKNLAGTDYQVAALVRGPAGAAGAGWGELTLYNSATLQTILLNGQTGVVHAASYQSQGWPGQTANYTVFLVGGGQVRLWFYGGILGNVTPS